jgi:muramoyltetrapeptide carboxypeptidase
MTALTLVSPAGVVQRAAPLRRAAKRLAALGFAVELDASALAKRERFAGDDEQRLAALHRVADAAPSIAMATRGGYGLTRLLDRIDWQRLAHSVDRGTRWIGHSDMTSLQLALLARAGRGSWAGPMAAYDLGRDETEGGVDDVTEACFVEAMSGELEAVGFRGEAGFDGLAVNGTLWGGNLSMVCALLGTRYLPLVKRGVLFLEDVNEHPYRIERCLLQLHQAGVLDAQRAVVLGAFTEYRKSPLDRGYGLRSAVARVREATRTPILTGLPFGHVPIKVSLPIGAQVDLAVEGREVFIGWRHSR